MIDGRGSGRTGLWQLRTAVVLVLSAMAWLVGTGSASALAALASTDPQADAVLSSAPAHVRLTFTEPVQVATGGVRIFDPDGRPVDDGQVVHPDGDGNVVQVGLRPGTALGSYTVSWRVISTDAHPVAGAFTFSVGHPSARVPLDGAVPSGGDPTVSALYPVVRALAFGAFAVLVGSVAFALIYGPSGLRRTAVRRLVLVGWGGLLAATVATFLLQGPYGYGLGLGAALSSDVLAGTLDLPLGDVLVGRMLLLGLIVIYLRELMDRLSSTERRARLVFAAVGRFSRIAFWCLVVLIGTGTYQSWHQLGSWSAFVTTDYGRLLLAKLVLVAVILGFAAISRRAVRRLREAPPATAAVAVSVGGGRPVQTQPPETQPPANPTRAVLRPSVLLETAVAAGVLAVTAVLVSTEPSRTEPVAVAGPLRTTVSFDTGGPSGAATMDVVVDPARTGHNEVRVVVRDPGGAARDVAELDVAMTLREQNLGPLRLPIDRDGVGSYRASGHLPVAGTWELALTVRTSDIDQTTVRVPVEVHSPFS